MTNFEFLIWLVGFLELCDPQPLTRKMLFVIRNHANLVKAVEKDGLGPLNTDIYDLVGRAIQDESMQRTPALYHTLAAKVQKHFEAVAV